MRNIIYISLFFGIFFSGCNSKHNQLFSSNKPVNSIKSNNFIPSIFSSNSSKFHNNYSSHQTYKISPHDRISILFYKYPELSTTTKNSFKDDLGVEVREDGTITLPIIKTVKVAGLTKDELEKYLYKRYYPYLTDPSLKVEILNQRVYVMGEVKNPGTLNLNKYKHITPLKAIVERGGLTNYANIHAIKVVRGNRENYKIWNIDLNNLQSIKANNIELKPNDIVYVPHNRAKEFNMPLNGINPSLNIINTIFNSISVLKVF